jgi:Bacterial Ig-like domain
MKLPLALLFLAACGAVTKPRGDDTQPDATGDDHTAPTVLSTKPADGATGVAADATITIAFSKAMDRASVEAAWQSDDLPASAVDFAWNAGDDTLVVTPHAPLEIAEGAGVDPSATAARVYHVSLAASATDAAGTPLAAAVNVGFATRKRMTAGCAPIDSLTRSMRGDGVVFGETAVTMTVGDTTANLQLKTFASFTLPQLPAGAAIESARLAANQNTTVNAPYTLGKLVALHVTTAAIDATAFAAPPLANAGALSTDATAGAKTLDVTDEVADDVANRAARGDRAQFRLELETATNNDALNDEARFSRNGMALAIVYVVD